MNDQTQKTLKECPLCGSDVATADTINDPANPDWIIQCHDCGASTGTWDSSEEASAAWNKRSGTPDWQTLLNVRSALRMIASYKLSPNRERNAKSLADMRGYAQDAGFALDASLILGVDFEAGSIVTQCLLSIRELLASKDVLCLGEADNGHGVKWPIRDEVIASINRVLGSSVGRGNENQPAPQVSENSSSASPAPLPSLKEKTKTVL